MKYDINNFKATATRIFLELFSCLIVFLGIAFKNSDSYLVYAEEALNSGSAEDKDPPVFTGEIELINEGEIKGFAKSVTVRVKAEDRGSGFDSSSFSFDGGKNWQKNGEYRITDNCRLNIQLKDRAGNTSGIKTVEIVNIDNQPPEAGKIRAAADKDKWDITLEGWSDNISSADKLLFTCISAEEAHKYEKDGRWDPEALYSRGSWQKDPHFRVDPGKHHIFALDEFGNIAEKDLDAGPLDNEPPVFLDAPVFTPESESGGYARAVTVTVNAKDRGSGDDCLYSFDDGASWQRENRFRVTENCALQIRAMDSLKNVSEKLTVEITNIDKEAPRLENADIRETKDGFEIDILKCTDNVTRDENICFLCLKDSEAPSCMNNNAWNAEALLKKEGWSGNRRIPVSPGNYFLFAKDELGNLTERDVQVSDTDKDPPVLAGDPVLTGEWGGNGYFRAVLISIKAADKGSGLNDYPYSFNNGQTWQESGSLRIVENQSVYIKLKDRAGNESPAIRQDITNIDNEAPILNVVENKQDLNENAGVFKITASDSLSGIAGISYRRKDTGAEVSLERIGEGQKKNTEKTVLLKEDGEYVFVAKDFAGNTAEKSVIVKISGAAAAVDPRKGETSGASLSSLDEGSSSSSGSRSSISQSSRLPEESKYKVKTSTGGSSRTSSGRDGAITGGNSPYISSSGGGETAARSGSGSYGASGSYGSSGSYSSSGSSGSGSAAVRSSGSSSGSGEIDSWDDPFTISDNSTLSQNSPYLVYEDPMSPEDITITDSSPGNGDKKPEPLYTKEESIPDSLIETAGDNLNRNRRKGIILMSVIIFVFLVSLTIFLLIKKGIIVLPEDETEDTKSGDEGYLRELIKKFDSLFPKAGKSA